MNSEWTLTSILNRLEDLAVSRVYKYNKQETINAKPSIQAGNEELEEYDCSLKLHVSICNPAEIIDILKKRQKSREPFDWIYRGNYKGSFVIESFEEKETARIKDVLISAEINFTLLENPLETEFRQQITGQADLSYYEQYQEGSNRLKEFALSVKNSITENLKETIQTAALSENISDAAAEIFENVKNSVMNDVLSGSPADVYNTARNYAEKIERSAVLETSDIKALSEAVLSLPGMILTSSLAPP